jgi:hypothetical protein
MDRVEDMFVFRKDVETVGLNLLLYDLSLENTNVCLRFDK